MGRPVRFLSEIVAFGREYQRSTAYPSPRLDALLATPHTIDRYQ